MPRQRATPNWGGTVWDWVVWRSPVAPGWWNAVNMDPAIEVRARSKAVLDARMDWAEQQHREQMRDQPRILLGFAPVVDVVPESTIGARWRPNSPQAAVPLGGTWGDCGGMVPIHERAGRAA